MKNRVQHGYLVLADISGYTGFMAGTELEHSQAILHDLLDLILVHFKPLLVLAEVEGDAVFGYAAGSKLHRGETLIEGIETLYAEFTQRKESMQMQTSCSCNACQSTHMLDLKFIVHYGEYVLQNLAGKDKPVGSDVNLAHRLLKNHVQEKTGWRGYVLFTHSSFEKVGVRPEGLCEMTESYEYFGDVATLSINLYSRYKALSEQRRVFITAEQAHAVLAHDFPTPPPVLWDWLTDPTKREMWMVGTKWTVTSQHGGRTGPGTANHCVHGKNAVIETILDWKPFNYYTVKITGIPISILETESLEEIERGTRLRAHIRLDLRLPDWMCRPIAWLMVKAFNIEKGWRKLSGFIKEEISSSAA